SPGLCPRWCADGAQPRRNLKKSAPGGRRPPAHQAAKPRKITSQNLCRYLFSATPFSGFEMMRKTLYFQAFAPIARRHQPVFVDPESKKIFQGDGANPRFYSFFSSLPYSDRVK